MCCHGGVEKESHGADKKEKRRDSNTYICV